MGCAYVKENSVISNRDVNLTALLNFAVWEEVWEGNKTQTAVLGFMLGGAKYILGCSSKTCSEAVTRNMGLETLHGHCKVVV